MDYYYAYNAMKDKTKKDKGKLTFCVKKYGIPDCRQIWGIWDAYPKESGNQKISVYLPNLDLKYRCPYKNCLKTKVGGYSFKKKGGGIND
jgi:hypothetical protein